MLILINTVLDMTQIHNFEFGKRGKNVGIFGVNSSFSVHNDNIKKDNSRG